MRASAALAVELDRRRPGRTVVRALRSAAPLTLVPRAGAARPEAGAAAVVHLVSSAPAPLGGDELELTVRVGPGARLRLHGVAATLALPGHRSVPSHSVVRIEVAEGARVDYLPEPTVVTARAWHRAELRVELAGHAVARCREVLVLGRSGEPAGRLHSAVHVRRAGVPLLRQSVDLGPDELADSPAVLAGHRVLATEVIAWPDVVEPAGGDWWALSPLAAGGALATALAPDAVTAQRLLANARAAHPAAADLAEPAW